MNHRKYFKHKIIDLEEIYNQADDDYAVLEELEEELEYRSTVRARKLLQNVKKHLHGCASTQSATLLQPSRKNEIPQTVEQKIDWSLFIKNNSEKSVSSGETIDAKPLKNKPQDIIDTWTVLECLSPQSYKKPQDLVFGTGSVTDIHKGQEPWLKGEKSRPKCRLYYLVFLGAVKLNQATEQLLKIYHDKRIELPNVKGLASLGVIILNKKGIPVPDTGLSISSFGWAYARAMQGRLDELKSWKVAEKALRNGLSSILYKEDEDGNSLPLSFHQIEQSHEWLVRNCEIPHQDTLPPTFAIRLYQPFSKGDPDSPLLNSFYLDDLQRVKKSLTTGKKGKALDQYLGIEKPKNQYDVLKNKYHIEEALQPKNTPAGRWPGRGRHSLVLLQQMAINLVMKELKESGLFSVNGPPGTGKTTLLRDIVAGVLVERAKALSKFKNTGDAFTHSGQIKIGNGFVHLYKLDNSLRGHEIVVASSNNKAVENVSRELPQRSQIAEDLPNVNYFKTVSDALSGENGSTWGLISSVLGNSKNKYEFINKAWWDDNTGLRNYFLSITGQVPQTGDDEKENIPKIILECDPPPNTEEAKQRWLKARKKFADILNKAEQVITIAQRAYEYQKKATVLREAKTENEIHQNKSNNDIQIINSALNRAQKVSTDAENSLKALIKSENSSKKLKPGFFKRLFNKAQWQNWRSAHNLVLSELIIAEDSHYEKKTKYDLIANHLKTEHENLAKLCSEHQKLTNEINTLQEHIDQTDIICVDNLVTNSLWHLPHEEQQKFSPNFLPEIQRLRDDVFVAAIELHKAFIDASAKQIRQNLGAFVGCLGGRKLPHDKRALLPHLWSSFFLLTPVISTTFASVGRMFKDLPHESIGWLLIDEAGQATPQAAIGAIHRAKRVISVGDPLQIEPVVTMPPALVEGFSKHLGIDPHIWMAPDASVQTLSDNANTYGTTIPRDLSEIRIGAPLLVHRRCEDPMFSISNRLAYAGLMVHATVSKPSKITEILGKSQWFDICGSGQEKWCPEEGDFVAEILLKVAANLQSAPDIFVISPFRLVAEKMRQRMRNDSSRFESCGVSDAAAWIKECIGTVHTFQGKEAQSVILLLGAPNPIQTGARNWATSNVNILNVAVSRAKQNLYIVGNKSLWAESGHMKTIANFL